MSGINSITYNLARHVADLLKPLVRKSKRDIENAKFLVEKLELIEVDEGEVLTSFDVTSLFTSVPGKEVVEMAVNRAKRDESWTSRIFMTTEEFRDLL